MADRVNLGLIPTSSLSWQTACQALDQERGGFLHIHENVDTGANSNRGGSDVVAGSRCILNLNDNLSNFGCSYESKNDKVENVVDNGTQCSSNKNNDINADETGCDYKNDFNSVNYDPGSNQSNGDGNDSSRCLSNESKNDDIDMISDNDVLNKLRCQCCCSSSSSTGITADATSSGIAVDIGECVISRAFSGKKLSENKRIVWCNFVRMMIGKLKSYFSSKTTTLQTSLTSQMPSPTTADWSVCLRHIELVKSYAPHVDHVVFDVECRPIK